MSGSIIKSIHGLQILDSRGVPTIAARIELASGTIGYASVPAGVSRGEFEAIELRDGNYDAYNGQGVLIAVNRVNHEIARMLIGRDAANQSEIDSMLVELDGTVSKGRLGANAMLAVSVAAARAAAAVSRDELFHYLNPSASSYELPLPIVSAIEGGVHAHNGLDVQEFLIVPIGAISFSHAVRMCSETMNALGVLLHDDGYDTGVNDSGGFAPRIEGIEEAFDLLLRAIERAGYKPGETISLGVNLSASDLVEESSNGLTYLLTGTSGGPKLLTGTDLIELYEEWISRYPIVTIEDGLGENDWHTWQQMTQRLASRVQLVGDDLFVTNCARIRRGIEDQVANAVTIKPSQIGTLSETLSAMQLAKNSGYKTVIAARAGETGDTLISDLAVACALGQFKGGAICRGERTEKYNRLLWIEDLLGDSASLAMPFAREI
jgi:enolase